METKELTQTVVSPEAMLEHWQGHRNLTRKTIETFPEKELFTFSVGGMRPFSELVMEIIQIAGSGTQGIVTNQWSTFAEVEEEYNKSKPTTKEQLLKLWDETTAKINEYWAQIPAGKFEEQILAFNMYDGPVYSQIFYFVDNEIHHRAQGYVYLRALGIAPPYFWER